MPNHKLILVSPKAIHRINKPSHWSFTRIIISDKHSCQSNRWTKCILRWILLRHQIALSLSISQIWLLIRTITSSTYHHQLRYNSKPLLRNQTSNMCRLWIKFNKIQLLVSPRTFRALQSMLTEIQLSQPARSSVCSSKVPPKDFSNSPMLNKIKDNSPLPWHTSSHTQHIFSSLSKYFTSKARGPQVWAISSQLPLPPFSNTRCLVITKFWDCSNSSSSSMWPIFLSRCSPKMLLKLSGTCSIRLNMARIAASLHKPMEWPDKLEMVPSTFKIKQVRRIAPHWVKVSWYIF